MIVFVARGGKLRFRHSSHSTCFMCKRRIWSATLRASWKTATPKFLRSRLGPQALACEGEINGDHGQKTVILYVEDRVAEFLRGALQNDITTVMSRSDMVVATWLHSSYELSAGSCFLDKVSLNESSFALL